MEEFPIGQLLTEVEHDKRAQNSLLYVQTGNGNYVPIKGNSEGYLHVKQVTSKVQEQQTEANIDTTTSTLTFAEPIEDIEIHNTSDSTGTFTVNDIVLTVPANIKFKASIGGTPSTSITVSGATTYIITRYA